MKEIQLSSIIFLPAETSRCKRSKFKMKISLLCLVFFFSPVLSDHQMNVQITEHHKCIVHVSESAIKQFNKSLEDGKKVIFFDIRYNNKQADHLTRPISDEHFANPNRYTWLFDGEHGLPVYMNAPYDFKLRSLFILEIYTKELTVYMNVSESCNESILSRVEFLRLVFHQLTKIVSTAKLPDKKAIAYICYNINNRSKLSNFTFMTYKRLGINREVLLTYCCEVKNIKPTNNETDLCQGESNNSSKGLDLQNYIGAFLFAFFPLAFGFISKAKLGGRHDAFAYVRSVSGSFHKGEQFQLPFGTEDCWISERDNKYSIGTFLKWLLLFDHSSVLASRIRRSLTVFMLLFPLLLELALQWYTYKPLFKTYLADNIPLGFRSLMFGIKESAKNTDHFLGGPFVWFLAFVILGLILITIPKRLCEDIAYSTLHQQETFTFLVQDIKLLQHYGSLDESNLHDYDLLYAILKSSLLTILNPRFWCAVIKRWCERCKIVYNCFDNSQVFYQLIGVCITFLCAVISFFLCACELLLCIIFYGCPQLVIWKAIPHSYTQLYICPLIRRRDLGSKTLGLALFLMSLPIYTFLFLFSTHLFLTTFQISSSYVMFTVIALLAKPDAIAFVLLCSSIFYMAVSIVKSVSETYQSLLKVSIKLAKTVCEDFVYKRLKEKCIYKDLFERIVERHHPIRFEVAKALAKVVLVLMFFLSCVDYFDNISFTLSTYIKIALLLLTTMIPKIMTVLNESVVDSRWKYERILKTIYDYKLVYFDNQDFQ